MQKPSDKKLARCGEKFIGIIRGIQVVDLEGLGNRVGCLIQDSYLMRGDQRLLVTVSLCGTLAEPDETADSLVKLADTLFYTSKQDGKIG